jgi:DNA polymerase-4
VRERIILHLDMDAFFASVEQRCNPHLRGKPVIVCGDPRGRSAVASASYEARRYGVRSAMPVTRARKLCSRGQFVEGDPTKYVSISLEILEILKAFSPIVEPYSIDEAFMDLSGCVEGWDGAVDVAIRVKRKIRQQTGLTGSVGLAPNKVVAKVASELQKPDGLTVIKPTDLSSMYYPLPVDKLFGVGPKTKQALGAVGIRTIGDLARARVGDLVETFGVNGKSLSLLARGKDSSPVIPYYEGIEEKSMGHEHTFPLDVSDYLPIERTLLQLCDQVGRRLRKGGVVASRVTVKIRYSDFRTITRSRSISYFTSDDTLIFEVARSLLLPELRGEPLRLIGVSASRLSHSPSNGRRIESHLFHASRGQLPILKVVDKIRDRFGEGAVARVRLFTDRPVVSSSELRD